MADPLAFRFAFLVGLYETGFILTVPGAYAWRSAPTLLFFSSEIQCEDHEKALLCFLSIHSEKSTRTVLKCINMRLQSGLKTMITGPFN